MRHARAVVPTREWGRLQWGATRSGAHEQVALLCEEVAWEHGIRVETSTMDAERGEGLRRAREDVLRRRARVSLPLGLRRVAWSLVLEGRSFAGA